MTNSPLLSAIELAMAASDKPVADGHPIPPITDPMGRGWLQPSRQGILIDDSHALMTQETFDALAEYSYSNPSGVYPGKMWKWLRGHKRLLCWYGYDSEPGFCSNNHREILIA